MAKKCFRICRSSYNCWWCKWWWTPIWIEKQINSGLNKIELHKLEKSLFKENETQLRGILWDYTRKYANENDYILIVDADEFYDSKQMNKFKKNIFKKIKLDRILYQ